MRPLVFVTTGNGRQPFLRLLESVDRLVGEGLFGAAEVLLQSGNDGGFRAAHCRQERFLPMDDFVDTVARAHLVISHAGAGTLLHLLHAGRVPVIMPRRRAFGECVDDHQLELVEVLAREGRVVLAMSPEALPAAVAEAGRRIVLQGHHAPPRMISLVASAIEELMGGSSNAISADSSLV